ncbi:MAG: hypothetical protein ACI89U_002173 [Gammaproteobacteria bacterium]|jgi:hypothetical protein
MTTNVHILSALAENEARMVCMLTRQSRNSLKTDTGFVQSSNGNKTQLRSLIDRLRSITNRTVSNRNSELQIGFSRLCIDNLKGQTDDHTTSYQVTKLAMQPLYVRVNWGSM